MMKRDGAPCAPQLRSVKLIIPVCVCVCVYVCVCVSAPMHMSLRI